MTITLCRTYFMLKMQLIHLAILCFLFGMVEWPFHQLNDLQLRDRKVTSNHLAYPIAASRPGKTLGMPFTSIPSPSSIINLESLMIFPWKNCFPKISKKKGFGDHLPLNPVSLKHDGCLWNKRPRNFCDKKKKPHAQALEMVFFSYWPPVTTPSTTEPRSQKGKVFTLLLYNPPRELTYPTLGKGKIIFQMPFLDIFGGYVSSLEDVYLLAQKKWWVYNWDVEYIDSIDEKKSPSWLHNVGGDFFTMLHPQARDHLATWKSKRCWIPWSVSWWSPPPKKTCLHNSYIKPFNPLNFLWNSLDQEKNRVKQSLFPVSLSGSPRCCCWCYPPWNKHHIPLKNILLQMEISSSNHWFSGCELVSFGLLTNSCISRLWFQPIWKNMPQIGSFPQRSGWK